MIKKSPSYAVFYHSAVFNDLICSWVFPSSSLLDCLHALECGEIDYKGNIMGDGGETVAVSLQCTGKYAHTRLEIYPCESKFPLVS